VKPTRSAKSTETKRRSTPVAAGAAAARAFPHSPQKRSSGSFAAPQVGHAIASGEPHSAQNFRPDRFSRPHDRQVTPPSTAAMAQSIGSGRTAAKLR
jgi:hypothetical protein